MYSDKLNHNPADSTVCLQKYLAKWQKPSHSNDVNLPVVKDKEKTHRKITLLLHEKTGMQIETEIVLGRGNIQNII